MLFPKTKIFSYIYIYLLINLYHVIIKRVKSLFFSVFIYICK